MLAELREHGELFCGGPPTSNNGQLSRYLHELLAQQPDEVYRALLTVILRLMQAVSRPKALWAGPSTPRSSCSLDEVAALILFFVSFKSYS